MMLVAWPVIGGLGGLLHGREARGGVVVGDEEQERGDGDADERAEVEVTHAGGLHLGTDGLVVDVAHQPVGDRVEGGGGEHAGDGKPLIERPLDVAGTRAHREGADDRGDDRDGAEGERVEHHLRRTR